MIAVAKQSATMTTEGVLMPIRRISSPSLQLTHCLNRKAAKTTRADYHQIEEPQAAQIHICRTVIDQNLEEISHCAAQK